jgi:hypothetical protein
VRAAFVHQATVVMTADGGLRALGAAVTLGLCGSWDHPPPCPLAAHHSQAVNNADTITLRTIFATDPANESLVRSRIDSALRQGNLIGPDGRTSSRAFLGARPGEAQHARRLTDG